MRPAPTRGDVAGAGGDARGAVLGRHQCHGRSNRSAATQVDTLSARIQMLSLAAQCRQFTTIRLPRSQGSLPVVSVTALTLWARAMHTLLTFRPQDNVTSAVPLLKARTVPARSHESEIRRLAQSPDTIVRAVGMYRQAMRDLPLHSLTPWVLLDRCHCYKVAASEQRWLARLLCALHGRESHGMHELLLQAYLSLGKERQLREAVTDLCIKPALVGASTLAAVLEELQGTPADHRLACRLWTALADLQRFRPSQTCVRLALKAAVHSGNIGLAAQIYRQVLAARWAGVRGGFWIEKVMIYGLAINRLPAEAFELAAATSSTQASSPAVAMQAAHRFELLLSGLSTARCAEELEAVFLHVRDTLGMRPTAAMYGSLLGALAWGRDWDEIERYLHLMAEDGHAVSASVWKRLLLGFSKQGRVDLCDRVLVEMDRRGVPCTYVVVQAAIQAFAQLGSLEMVLRWYRVVAAALTAHAQLSPAQQRVANVDGTVTSSSGTSCAPALGHPTTLEQPESFTEYFIARNELVWHRSALSALIDVVGELGDAPLLLQLWDDIWDLRRRVRTLRLSPHMYMTFARSLAWHGLLDSREGTILLSIRDPGNGFSYAQQQEAAEFVVQCRRGDRAALCRLRMRPRGVDIVAPLPEDSVPGAWRPDPPRVSL
ncbi:hypothetical protein H4R19_004278 [Coemansia spiralis]|nr:hypothetical protein H4R19_004278 [Coemansia spiralis]